MSLSSRISGLFSNSTLSPTAPAQLSDRESSDNYDGGDDVQSHIISTFGTNNEDIMSSSKKEAITAKEADFEMRRPPYLHAMLAGGLGGTTGDAVMHSLDTVKTRQQGDPHFPPKYTTLGQSYATIYRQEGLRRGLYGGFTAAMLGSFPGTVIFFGTYEYTKRKMLDSGLNPSLTFLTGGFLADLAASLIYVPSEVLKTRLQLQGRPNNPHFYSGYNYKSTFDAFRTIVRTEGASELFTGYKATIFRDLPFSAFQFAFYEQERRLAQEYVGKGNDIGLGLEIFTAASAGGMAGVLTCPLDVVKTRTQTQVDAVVPVPSETSISKTPSLCSKKRSTQPATAPSSQSSNPQHPPTPKPSTPPLKAPKRHFHASSGTVKPGIPHLDTESVLTGLRIIYKTEGFAGWFRGVGPRGVWTSVQSGTMLVLYQYLVGWFGRMDPGREEGDLI